MRPERAPAPARAYDDEMRRVACILASVASFAACNALTGVADLSPCATCEVALDGDASASNDAGHDGPGERPDVDADGPADGAIVDAPVPDAGASLGCQGAADCTRVVFVTSTTFAGNLGGVAGADAKCQALADLSPLARIKGHTFLAWLGTSTTSPSARFTHGTMPYVLAAGQVVAANWLDLTDGILTNGISVDELGTAHGSQTEHAWDGTASNGGTIGQSCMDWTAPAGALDKGRYGRVGDTGSGWSGAGDDDCGLANSLYCFEK